jgi:hypothetical protein
MNNYQGFVFSISVAIILIIATIRPQTAVATKCDCRPDFPVESEADGTCEVTRDDKNWCVIKFNSSTGQATPRQTEFLDALGRSRLPQFDNVVASNRFLSVAPELWDLTFIQDHLAALLAVALWDSAPQRLPVVISLIRENARELLPAIQDRSQRVTTRRLGNYSAALSYGCFELSERDFSVMIKTRFSTAPRRCGWP